MIEIGKYLNRAGRSVAAAFLSFIPVVSVPINLSLQQQTPRPACVSEQLIPLNLHIRNIQIPKIGLNEEVTSISELSPDGSIPVLSQGVAQLLTPLYNQVMVDGHTPGVFGRLKEVELGDEITLMTEETQILDAEVESIEIIPRSTPQEVFHDEDFPTIDMITTEKYGLTLGTYLDRVVKASIRPACQESPIQMYQRLTGLDPDQEAINWVMTYTGLSRRLEKDLKAIVRSNSKSLSLAYLRQNRLPNPVFPFNENIGIAAAGDRPK